ncbi:MAG: PQQ-binding-like beta-propeller repeat protein, partial [Chthoniobacteraceae bacterium]
MRLLLLLLSPLALHAENWPQWRGSRLDGTSIDAAPPTSWSAIENITWKTQIPGQGHASPIIWNDRVFVVSADEATSDRLLICIDRANGAIIWKDAVLTAPPEPIHRLNTHASSTPATDGERVFTTFLDTDQVVVAAHDFSGRRLWLKRPGRFSSMHGFCSSPIIHEDKVIVNCD